MAISEGLLPLDQRRTNQVAGALAIPRRTFLTGVVPATVVYVSVFVGIGTVFGAAALTTIRSIDSLLVAVLVPPALLAVAVISALRLHRRARRLAAGPSGTA
jgi:membrane protein DedA with SNARE-associated domain